MGWFSWFSGNWQGGVGNGGGFFWCFNFLLWHNSSTVKFEVVIRSLLEIEGVGLGISLWCRVLRPLFFSDLFEL